jgi:hypothetical protein
VLVLDPNQSNGALSLGGENRLIVRKGDVIVNSTDQSALFNANSSIEVLAGSIGLAGNFMNLGKAVTKPKPRRAQQVANPYETLKLPAVTNVVSKQKLFLHAGVPETLRPGVYQGGINVGKGVELTLQPGTYLFINGDFFVTEAKVRGDGVTIIMWGAKPGKLLFANGADVELSAPREGDLKDMLILSAGKLEGTNTDVGFNGCQAKLTGVVDAPLGRVGVFFNAKVSVTRVCCFQLMLNTGAMLEVTGEPPAPAPAADGEGKQ